MWGAVQYVALSPGFLRLSRNSGDKPPQVYFRTCILDTPSSHCGSFSRTTFQINLNTKMPIASHPNTTIIFVASVASLAPASHGLNSTPFAARNTSGLVS